MTTVEQNIVGIRDHILMSKSLTGKVASLKPPPSIERSMVNIFIKNDEDENEITEKVERISYESTQNFQCVIFEISNERIKILEAALKAKISKIEIIVGSVKFWMEGKFFVSFDDCGPNIGFRITIKVAQ